MYIYFCDPTFAIVKKTSYLTLMGSADIFYMRSQKNSLSAFGALITPLRTKNIVIYVIPLTKLATNTKLINKFL
jgi:hypothetical protein